MHESSGTMRAVTMNRPLWYGVGRALIVVSLLSACGSVTPKMPPEATDGTMPTTYLANRMPTPQEKFAMHSVENSYFGVTDTRRSLALGLLLGPIGVAANMAHVRGESERRSDEVKSLLGLDAGALLRTEAPDLSSAQGAAIDGRRLEVVQDMIESHVEGILKRINGAFNALDLGRGGFGAEVHFTSVRPTGPGPWRWEVTPRWRRSPSCRGSTPRR